MSWRRRKRAAGARVPLASGAELVLLDIWMPDTDGVTLLERMGAAQELTMPVDQDVRPRDHRQRQSKRPRSAALNFLEKPIALQKLLKAVEQGLTRGTAAVALSAWRRNPRCR